jgi:hypothetical protein
LISDQVCTVRIRIEADALAQANRGAAELRSTLEKAGDEIQIQTIKERHDTQDLGATLILVLGTKAAFTLAKAIHSYIAKRGDRVVIETNDGKILASGSGATNIDVSKTVAALRSQGHE